jgi:predicted ribosomally synthesized peptide with SipW-like signal peptide
VLAVAFGAGTFAPFTATDTIDGQVKAGVLTMDLADSNSTDNVDNITFDPTAVCDGTTGELTDDPEDACTATIQVCNGVTTIVAAEATCDDGTSNLELILLNTSSIAESGDANGCFSATVSAPAGGISFPGATTVPNNGSIAFQLVNGSGVDVEASTDDSLDPGQTATFLITVTLTSPAPANCQAQTVTYTVTANAQQSASPHD